MDELIEAMALELWQAESERATDRRRRTNWADESEKTRAHWGFMARAALTALQSKGWVVVPVEPTEEMVLAADRMGFRAPRNFWNEMLLASPMNDLLRAQTRSTKADRSAG